MLIIDGAEANQRGGIESHFDSAAAFPADAVGGFSVEESLINGIGFEFEGDRFRPGGGIEARLRRDGGDGVGDFSRIGEIGAVTKNAAAIVAVPRNFEAQQVGAGARGIQCAAH